MSRSQCLKCNHYQLSRKKCKAFPLGIPTKIYNGDFDHSMPFEGDRGFRYVDLEIVNDVEDQREKVPKLIRIDFEVSGGVVEHYSLTNSETRGTTSYLVVPLPEKLRARGDDS